MKYQEDNIQEALFNSDAQFEECEFKGIDFTSINLVGVSFLNCVFRSCNLSNQVLLNASFRDVSFESCKLIGINWCRLRRMENMKFLDSKMDFSSFQGLKLKKLQVLHSSAVEVDFSSADLTQSQFSRSNLNGSNFNKSILVKADFRDAEDYAFDVKLTKIEGAKFNMPGALNLLRVLGAEVEY